MPSQSELERRHSEAQAQALQLIRAYKVVFGTEGARTDAQRLVIADLKTRGGVNLPSFRPDEKNAFCPLRAAVTDGRRAIVLETLAAIDRSAEDKPKTPEVKKP